MLRVGNCTNGSYDKGPPSLALPPQGEGQSLWVNLLFTGTSGFSYATWKGKFYPARLPGSKMLEYYAQRLNGVELNGSFYRTPPEKTLHAWRDSTPEGFAFCMKANRGLTYSAEGFDRVGLAGLFTQRIDALDDRIGPVLLQFPPTRGATPSSSTTFSRRSEGRSPWSSGTTHGSTTRQMACSRRMARRWWSQTRRSGRVRSWLSWGRRLTSGFAAATTSGLWPTGRGRSGQRSMPTLTCTSISSMTRRLLGWR